MFDRLVEEAVKETFKNMTGVIGEWLSRQQNIDLLCLSISEKMKQTATMLDAKRLVELSGYEFKKPGSVNWIQLAMDLCHDGAELRKIRTSQSGEMKEIPDHELFQILGQRAEHCVICHCRYGELNPRVFAVGDPTKCLGMLQITMVDMSMRAMGR